MILKNVRLAFESLFEASTVQGEGAPKFSATFIIESGSPLWKQIQSHIEEIAEAKWGKHAKDILADLKAKERVCFSDKPKRNKKTREIYSGFEGNCWVSASNAKRPAIVDRDKTPLTKADGRPYSGSFVNADVDFWVQDNNYGQRINCSLIGVQFAKDGEAFGGRSGSADAFDSLAVEEDDDGLGS